MSLEHLNAPQRKKGPQVLCARTQGSLNGAPSDQTLDNWGLKKNPGVFQIPNEKAGVGGEGSLQKRVGRGITILPPSMS